MHGGGTSIVRRPGTHETKYTHGITWRNELMPIITLEMGPLTTEQKEKLIVAFTRDVCEVTGMPPESMLVLIHELPRENMGVAGQQLSKMKR
jgi:4-oxalocrotonate tautomerase